MPIDSSKFSSNSLTGTVRVVNGFANISLPTAFYALEGNVTFTVQVRTDSVSGAVIYSSPTVTLRDTSSFVSLTANTATVNEGDLVAFTLVTANALGNSTLYYSVFPATANVTSSDFVANTGSFSLTNNAGIFTLKANADLSLMNETGENFRVQLRTVSSTGNVVYTTSNIAIQDTSNAFNILTFAPSASTSLENSNVTFTFTATNVPFGTVFYYETTGNALVSANTGSFVLNSVSNTFAVVAGAVPASATRAFTVNLRTGSAAGPIVATSSTAYVIDSALAYMNATGGNEVYTIGGYRVHKFLSSNNFTITKSGASSPLSSIEVLMVAGGGAGAYANQNGTGAGAGGLLYYGANTTPKTPNGSAFIVNTNDTYAITVGAGGSSGGANGSNTTIAYNSNTFLIALGGGYGSTTYGGGGGSGGGGGYGYPAGANGTAGQGNPGGNSTGPFPSGANRGGGGGGAGAAGGNGPVGGVHGPGGLGGNGLAYDISGAYTAYAGGGGGSGSPYVGTSGGIGGGGFGNYFGGGGPGEVNTGGGGGSGSPGGSGGPGIVIIRYPFVDSPTYTSLTTPTTFIYESANAVFTLNTLNLANNTLLYYTTVGNIISSDFVSGNTGSFRSTSNTTTISLATNSNIPTNEERYFQLQVRADSLTDPVVATSNVFTIKDSGLQPKATSIQYLVVAGGGGGGGQNGGGGGGAGGYLANSAYPITPATPYTITVGSGGGGGPSAIPGTSQNAPNAGTGSNSSFGAGVVSFGGGGGGAYYGQPLYFGAPGGSAGGAGGIGNPASFNQPVAALAIGSPGWNVAGTQGYPSGRSALYFAGGGGGAGGSGLDGSPTPGSVSGGIGLLNSISGTSMYYAGGGAGAGANAPTRIGGLGGGGTTGPQAGSGGTVNTGGGGGGSQSADGSGSSGGSGIVVIRYPDTFATATTTGSPNVIYANANIIYRFWQSGSITFP